MSRRSRENWLWVLTIGVLLLIYRPRVFVGLLVLATVAALSLYVYDQHDAALREAEEKAAVAKQMTDAGLLLSRGKSDEAEKIIATIEPHHTLVLFYSAFGHIHGRRADWKTARDFYVKSVEFAPADELSYYCLAPLLAQLDDIERLRHYREQMIKQFGTTSDSRTAPDRTLPSPG